MDIFTKENKENGKIILTYLGVSAGLIASTHSGAYALNQFTSLPKDIGGYIPTVGIAIYFSPSSSFVGKPRPLGRK